MPDIPPPGAPPPGQPNPLNPQNPEKKPPQSPAQGTVDYSEFTFTSHRAYIEFKTKFLVNIANEAIRQIKIDTDRIVQALRKMREEQ